MTIHPERLRNAVATRWFAEWASDEVARVILTADDRLRETSPQYFYQSHPIGSGGTTVKTDDPEPKLPDGVTHEIKASGSALYDHEHRCCLYMAGWTVSDLRAIADHMDWTERQRQREAEVTDAMVDAAVREYVREAPRENGENHVWHRPMAAAIRAALAAQRKGAT